MGIGGNSVPGGQTDRMTQEVMVYGVLALTAIAIIVLIVRRWRKPDECAQGCTECPLREGCKKVKD